MNLTFTPDDRHYSWRGQTDSGLTLFTISPSTARGDAAVTLRVALPGIKDTIRVEAPEGAAKYSREARTAAIEKAARLLRGWAAKHLGVDLDVNVIDNT
ncbi:hypothetical protein ABT369_39645 [Dactylosporangium sp. NPDC000244]|uniref:hypothetical protein n=1 Tax=Dactylosporangium sp. NPDC000244 TaxID=3154365 RepID=UPI00332DBADE